MQKTLDYHVFNRLHHGCSQRLSQDAYSSHWSTSIHDCKQPAGLGMGFSAGAMIYIVVEKIIPETLQELSTCRKIATVGFFLGFYVMLYLDLLLG
jgi:zinc transporter ZupT